MCCQSLQAVQRIQEWRATFGSTAISVLMAIFASMPEYGPQEAHMEYADYQLQDSRFIYKDADSVDQPGAFMSEFVLCIFAMHVSAIVGKVRVDALGEFGALGYQAALALTAAAASSLFLQLH
jgi:hypothetical protein